jgi:DNA-binding transcriptional regulator YdaS (Cro superfamily)
MDLRTWMSMNSVGSAALAVQLGVTVATISRWCAGRRHPRPADLRRIAEATGGKVTANDFCGVAAGAAIAPAGGAA